MKNLMKIYTLVFAWVLAMMPATHYAQVAIPANCGMPAVPFAGFMGAGVQPMPAAGQLSSNDWAFTGFSDGDLPFGGSNTTGDYARGNTAGGVTTGGLYALNGQAMWIQPAGSDFNPGTATLKAVNNSGAAIANLSLSYDLIYRNDQGRASSFNFSYSLDNMTYTSVPSLNFTSPEAADAMGNVVVPKTTTLNGVNLANGANIYFRWTGADVSGAGSRDEFGIDNITFCDASVAPPPPNAAVPTMSEWGMFLFALIMLTLGVVFVFNAQHKLALSGANNVAASVNTRQLPFEKATFAQALMFALVLSIPGFVFIQLVWGEILAADFFGMALTVPVVAYLIHLLMLFGKDK
ncbi:MAG: hypothetical protein H6577_14960 [Lewinellaceae bacterium]|nr:hypothetical protein [Saprospiraceae bacterium]MCB9339427.1 hypothetical protein [Lewinellaceae bacterium]